MHTLGLKDGLVVKALVTKHDELSSNHRTYKAKGERTPEELSSDLSTRVVAVHDLQYTHTQ